MQDFLYAKAASGGADKKKPWQLYHREEQRAAPLPARRDFEYFKSLYPQEVRKVQAYVEEICDEMEYAGSPIYDEYPDRVMIEGLIRRTEQRMNPEMETGAYAVTQQEVMEAFVCPQPGYRMWEPEEAQLLQAQEQRGRGPVRPPVRPPEAGPERELLSVLLLNELHGRRCRQGFCR